MLELIKQSKTSVFFRRRTSDMIRMSLIHKIKMVVHGLEYCSQDEAQGRRQGDRL